MMTVDLGGVLRWSREHWPVTAGAIAAMVPLARSAPEFDGSALAMSFAALSAGLATQIVVASRQSLQRERRLVQAGAELRLLSARLEEAARTDSLTGLKNRRALIQDLGLELRRAERYGRPLALLMLDVDQFKRINDEYGHLAGDAVLMQTAEVLRGVLRASDVVARFGGEEFVVVLPEARLDAAAAVAEKLRAAVEAHEFVFDEACARMTVSVGVAAVEGARLAANLPGDALIARADAAMYAAKQAGRNCVVVESPQGVVAA